MDIVRGILPASILLLLVLSPNGLMSGIKHNTHTTNKNHTHASALPAKRAWGSHVDGLAIAIGMGSLIMGIACTETGGCSPDLVTEKINALQSKVDSIENQITSLQKEVAEIKQDLYIKWYLDLIKFVTSQMTKVAAEALNENTNQQNLAMREKFVHQNLGIQRDDYVSKGLFLIPKLVTDDKIIEHYLDYHRNLDGVEEATAVEKTCAFAKRILDYQDDGYTSLIIAYSIVFKEDLPAYNDALAETCTLWRTESSPEYTAKCDELESIPGYEDRRQPQVDHILGIKGLGECTLNNPPPNKRDRH